MKRAPGSLAERFWSIARSVGASGDDSTDPDPKAIVRHVLKILDALSAGEVGDGVSQSTLSFLTLLRQHEAQGDMSYASPEQARGESLDERSLVFSVGVLLFEELTGRHPFGAVPSARRFSRIQKGEMGSGVQYFPQVPSQLRTVLMRAMGPFPEERYANLREMRRELERFVTGAKEPSPVPRPRSPLKGLPPTPADLVFGSAADEAATQILRRTPAHGTPAMPAAAPLPGEVKKLTREQAAPTIEVPTRASEPPLKKNVGRAIAERLLWIAVGAGVSLGATFIALRNRPLPTPPVTPVAAVPVAAAAPAAAPVAAPAPAAPKVTALPAAKPGGNAELPSAPAAIAPQPAAEPPPAVFDMNYAGKNAANAARQCFVPMSHNVSFGVGLMFSKEDAMARRVFLSPDEPLDADQRKCLKTALLYVSSGAAPDKSSVVELRLRLKPGDGSKDEIRAVLGK